ncbi:spore cortex biosynthesis protein YabQ [Virgibacillus phasianinus]|uniref:Spore cortex biosynthesis protein YabQ n=1 Tax=Virgibacillus phasianinus TaxID=2017483 RepID=A0A220U1H1_9BACI|nr:spore cortex biosynthesis protein YabQ [Virgibacillus phasianinus]ASK61701.1 spore cortex biosynthesis protein YabQ [Virgibacillus phasianinus]
MILSTQFMTMLAMVLGGFYLGIILDTFRRASPHWRNSVFLTYLMEICFWLSQTLFLFYILYRVNAGELRLYVFAACLLGFAAYQALAASLYKKLLEHIIQFTLSIYRFFAKAIRMLIVTPVVFVVTLLFSAIAYTFQVLFLVLLTICKIVLTPFKWIFMFIYRLLPETIKKYLHKIAGFYSTMKNISKKWLKYIKFKRR